MYRRVVLVTFKRENRTEEDIVNPALFDTALVTALQDDRRSRAELHRATVGLSPATSILGRLRWPQLGGPATRKLAPFGAAAQTPQGTQPV